MADTALFPPGERDKLILRLQNAVGGFVDGPGDAVEDADRVLEDTIQHLTAALAERRRTIRTSWQPPETTPEATPKEATNTEQLRLALRDYRETTERLLQI
ncbi:hypothetical protein [Streptomyces kanamyceticus]|uniref:Uncharacterized protein n=1 Tax=Streptomyces kanamyceticus TaxID=1967 RepID=A0A5J6GKN3_STRKN|nr:hypothetical protein [Streptomyces kanamyceticus]QEU94651.1 hypothetical protein CP970_30525 [Streptomyces kanamyceticus]